MFLSYLVISIALAFTKSLFISLLFLYLPQSVVQSIDLLYAHTLYSSSICSYNLFKIYKLIHYMSSICLYALLVYMLLHKIYNIMLYLFAHTVFLCSQSRPWYKATVQQLSAVSSTTHRWCILCHVKSFLQFFKGVWCRFTWA